MTTLTRLCDVARNRVTEKSLFIIKKKKKKLWVSDLFTGESFRATPFFSYLFLHRFLHLLLPLSGLFLLSHVRFPCFAPEAPLCGAQNAYPLTTRHIDMKTLIGLLVA